MNAVTVVGTLSWTVFLAAFVPLWIHASSGADTLPGGIAVALAICMMMSLLQVFALLAFSEDMSRIGLPSEEKKRWQILLFASGPIAMGAYWWRYIRRPRATDEGPENR